MDNRSKEARSRNMSNIPSTNTKPEETVRKYLFTHGFRYRKNVSKLPGKPDIVFKGKKIAVFCDSEFWHGYNWEERKKDFKSHQEFWIPKIERNMQRDIEVTQKLESDGWTVLRFWGNEIKKETQKCADIIEKAVKSNENI